MATNYPLKVNGVTIKTPSSFKISRYNLTKAARLASGTMAMEFIAKKKKLFIRYNVISGDELQTILDEIDTNTMFFEVKYYDTQGVQQTITCYVGEIPTELQRRPTVSDQHYWKNIEFNFIEQ